MYQKLLDRGAIPIILLFLAAAAAMGAFLPRFSVDAGTNALLNEDDRDLEYYNITRPTWGYDEYAIVCARRADWFTPESLDLLKELTAELGKAPNAKSILSILTVPLLRNQPPAFGGFPVLTPLSSPKADVAKAKKELLEHTQALGNLISQDGRDLSILVYLDVPGSLLLLEPQWSRAQGLKDRAALASIEKDYEAALTELRARRKALIAAVRAVAARFSPRMDEPIRLSGLPIITVNLVEHVSADLYIFGVASFVLFLLAFLVIYRKARWTAMPILACLIPVVLVVGAMAMTGKKVTVITSNLPVLLFVLMLPYTVYFVERYRERRSLYPAESNLDSSAGAGREIWVPCLYSATTTMAGFASLLTSGINPVRVFGLMMTIGMAVGLACVFLFLPALSRPLRPLEVTGAGTASEPKGPVRWLARLVLGAPGWVVVFSAALLGLSAWGATKITVETKFIDYFWPKSEVYKGLDYIDNRMGGTTPMEIMLTSKKPGFFKTPEGLQALAAASSYFQSVPETGNVRSLKTLIDEARKALKAMKDEALINTVVLIAGPKLQWQCAECKGVKGEAPKAGEPDPPAGTERPKSCPTCKGERPMKFTGIDPGLVGEFCNRDFTVSRVMVRFKETAPTLNRKRILDGLAAHLKGQPELADLAPRPTGVFVLYSNMLQSLIQSQRDTFAMVLAAIWVMLVVLFVSFPGLSKGAATAIGVACFLAAAAALGAWLVSREGSRGLLLLTQPRWVAAWLGLSLVLLLATAAAILKGAGSVARWALDTTALPTLVLVPQVLPVLGVMGTMGFTGIPLDMVTVMISSIAMGVGIDAAIQYTVRYRIELGATGGDRRAAVTRSHATIGRAIWIATSIVVAGFIVLSLSKFVPTVTFGLFTALAMLLGQFAALTLLPSLFLLFKLPRT